MNKKADRGTRRNEARRILKEQRTKRVEDKYIKRPTWRDIWKGAQR